MRKSIASHARSSTGNEPSSNYAGLGEQYGPFWPWLVACLFRHDPMRLDFGDNQDEYELEAADLLTQLPALHSGDEVARAARSVFAYWFEGLDLGSKTVYQRLGSEIWVAWVLDLAARPMR